MPFDNRRIAGPDGSQPVSAFPSTGTSPSKHVSLVDNGKRADGRGSLDFRPIFLKVGVISRAKGSAYIEMDKTKAVCAVYGPREITRRQVSLNGYLQCELKFAPFSHCQQHCHQADVEEKELSLVLQQALEPAVCLHKFPKAKVDVYVTVLENDGSALAAAITCAGAALANAGVDMYDLIIGCSMSRVHNNIYLDPVYAEEMIDQNYKNDQSRGSVTLGLMPSMQQICALINAGLMEQNDLAKAIKTLTDACYRILPAVKECVIKGMQKRLLHIDATQAT